MKKQQLNKYQRNFGSSVFNSKNSKCFESITHYLYYHKRPQRLSEYNSKLKLIVVILRNLAERAFTTWATYHYKFKSHLNHNYHDRRSFKTAIRQEMDHFMQESSKENSKNYIKRGLYYEQLLQYFEREQILIKESNDLMSSCQSTITTISEFLDIHKEELNFKVKNKSIGGNKNIYNQELAQLKKFYEPFNESFFQPLDRRYDWN